MIYSNACEYAIRSVLHIAERARPDKYVLLRDIVERSDMPRQFVGKILQVLVRAEILISSKGRGGGFALARDANRITLRQIVEAIDGPERIERCVLGFAACDNHQPCPQHDAWMEIREQIHSLLNDTTVEDLQAALDRKMRQARRRGPFIR